MTGTCGLGVLKEKSTMKNRIQKLGIICIVSVILIFAMPHWWMTACAEETSNTFTFEQVISRMGERDGGLAFSVYLDQKPDFSLVDDYSYKKFSGLDDGFVYLNENEDLLYYLKLYMSARNENGFIINDGILLDYIGTDTDITIPDDVNVIMGLNAVPFGKCKYKESADWYVSAAKRITIPATVSYILDSFDYCDCVRFLPRNGNSLTIGNDCFNRLGYSEIDDPVKHFELPEGLCEVGRYCFEGGPVFTLPSSLRRIGDYSFEDCREIDCPFEIDSVGEGSFSSTHKVNIGSTVNYASEDAFQDCGLIVINGEIRQAGKGALEGSGVYCENGNGLPAGFSNDKITMCPMLPPYLKKDQTMSIKQLDEKGFPDQFVFNPFEEKYTLSTPDRSIIRIINDRNACFIRGLNPGTATIILTANGRQTTCKVKVAPISVTKRINAIKKKYVRKNRSNEKNIIAVTNYLEKYIKYDHGMLAVALGKNAVPKGKHGSELACALFDGYAVCQGQAEALQAVLDSAGIDNRLKFDERGLGHVWNLVNVGKNKWTNIDITTKRYGNDKYFKRMGYQWDPSEKYPKANYTIKGLVSDGKTD